MSRVTFVAILLSAALSGDLLAQAPSPPRDNQNPTAGTARIRGKVIAADTGAPLRRAQVTLAAGQIGIRRMAMTDAEGRYEFLELPAGRYNVTAAKGSYVSLQYGQRRAFEPGLAVNVSDAQDVSQIDIPLPRGSVIAGRVTDEFGEPLAGVLLQVQRYRHGPSGRRLAYAGGGIVQSDDRGEFRAYGLMPGDYVVSGTLRTPGFQMGNDPTTGGEGYAPTFYPSTTNPADAEAVVVGIAQEVSIHLTLVASRLGRISGVVRDSTGRARAGARLVIRSTSIFTSAGSSGPDGSFTLSNIPPGEHTVQATTEARGADEPAEYGAAMVTVGRVIGREDVSNLTITMGRAASVAGVVEFSGTAPRTGTLDGIRIVPQPVDPEDRNPTFILEDRGVVAADGTFQVRGTGTVFFRAINLGPWTLKSVVLDGEDITDTPYDLQPGGAIEGLRIVLTDKLADVSGHVTNARREELKDFVVVVQPTRDMPGMTLQRFLRTARPDQQGRFNFRALPPGDYVATAVEALEQGREWDPEYRPKLRDAGRQFSVQEGQSIDLDLSIATGL